MEEQKGLLEKINIPLSVVIIFHTLVNLVWHTLNTAPPTWDSAGHLVIGYLFSDKIVGLFQGTANLVGLVKLSSYYPPFVQFLGGLVYLVLGRSYEITIFLVGTIFLSLAIIYLYKIIKYLTNGNEYLALLTVVIFSLFPGLWEQSRQFHLDVPLVALLLGSFYHLLLSRELTDRRHSLMFFLLFSLSQLTKWYGFVYLMVPFLLLVVAKAVKRRDWGNQKRILNTILGSIIVLTVAVPWYLFNLQSIRDNVLVSATADAGDPLQVWSYESIFHYLKLITSHQIGIVSLVLVFISMAYVYKNADKWSTKLFYFTAIPYLVFTFIQNKDLRYILPLTPMFAFYIAYIIYVGSKKFRDAKVIAYLGYLLFIFFFFSFNRYQVLPEGLYIVAKAYAGPGYWQTWVNEPYGYSYNDQDWRGDEIVKKINEHATSQSNIHGQQVVLQISDNRFYSSASFDLYLLQNRFYNLRFKVPFYRFDPFSPEELQEYLSDVNLALIPEDPGPPGLRNIAVLNQLVNHFRSGQAKEYELVEEFEMPDGNRLFLYNRINYSGYVNPGIQKNSMKVYVSDILLLDKELLPPQTFNIIFNMFDGTEKTVEVKEEGPAQERIDLEDVERFRIAINPDRQNVIEIRGWEYFDGVYERDLSYDKKKELSGNKFYYKDFKITPDVDVPDFDKKTPLRVTYYESEIIISLDDTSQTAFVAYASGDWVWNQIVLSSQNAEVKVPLNDLKQLEVTKSDMLISDFDPSWGYFVCYTGDAVCFYPPVDEFQP